MKFKKDECYRVKFLDHTSFDDVSEAHPFICEVFGKVTVIEKDHIVIYNWITYEKNGEVSDSNTDGYVILKSTILEVEYFGRPSV